MMSAARGFGKPFAKCAVIAALFAAVAFAPAPAARAGEPGDGSGFRDWAALESIEVLTRDAGGEARRTRIWILVQDGRAYIRAGAFSTWGDNVERTPVLTLVSDASERRVRATAVRGDAARARVIRGFREKYGGADAVMELLRGEARIWSLESTPGPRTPPA